MADSQKPVIIIRKKKKGGHGGHHGGAWKVAYADFVTAMMSFFLLLWLLNVTTADQRAGLADYFAPASISKSNGGAGGVMGGLDIKSDKGSKMSDSSPPTSDERMIPTAGKGEEGEEDNSGKAEKSGETKEQKPPAPVAEEKKPLTDDQAIAEATRREEQHFQETETQLKKAIEGSPELKDLVGQLIIDRTPEGLRIQIVDREKFSLFPSGSAIPYEKGRDLLRLVGKVIARLPNTISITGHTDSNPYSLGSRRDNWSLSTERATVSLGQLIQGGLVDQRVSRVVGMADRDPLNLGNPKDPQNRRISIVLLRQSYIPAPSTSTTPPPVDPKTPSPSPLP